MLFVSTEIPVRFTVFFSVEFKIAHLKADDLKTLHRIVFGKKGTVSISTATFLLLCECQQTGFSAVVYNNSEDGHFSPLICQLYSSMCCNYDNTILSIGPLGNLDQNWSPATYVCYKTRQRIVVMIRTWLIVCQYAPAARIHAHSDIYIYISN